MIALLIPAAVLAAGDSEGGFDGVVHFIEGRYHVRATHIPFLGLVSFIARKSTQGGVSGLHVTEIENFREAVDGEELNRMVEEKLGPGWERLIRETSCNGHQQTLVFSHPERDRMGLFVLDLDGRNMDVVQLSVDPNHLNESLRKFSRHREDDRDSGASD
jgi:hypothetical protein